MEGDAFESEENENEEEYDEKGGPLSDTGLVPARSEKKEKGVALDNRGRDRTQSHAQNTVACIPIKRTLRLPLVVAGQAEHIPRTEAVEGCWHRHLQTRRQ